MVGFLRGIGGILAQEPGNNKLDGVTLVSTFAD